MSGLPRFDSTLVPSTDTTSLPYSLAASKSFSAISARTCRIISIWSLLVLAIERSLHHVSELGTVFRSPSSHHVWPDILNTFLAYSSSFRSQSILLREVLRVSRPSTTVQSFVVLSYIVPSSLCRADALLKNPLIRSRNLPTQEISLFAAMRPCGFFPGLRPGLPFGLWGPSSA